MHTLQLAKRLQIAMSHLLDEKKQSLASTSRDLKGISNLQTLARGYAIVLDDKDQIVRKANQVEVGQKIEARLDQGRLFCQVLANKDD